MHCKNCETLAEIVIKKEQELNRCYKALEEIERVAKGMGSVFVAEFSNVVKRLTDRIYRESTARFELILDIINKAGFNKSERCETRHSESCVVPVEPSIIQEAKGKNHEI